MNDPRRAPAAQGPQRLSRDPEGNAYVAEVDGTLRYRYQDGSYDTRSTVATHVGYTLFTEPQIDAATERASATEHASHIGHVAVEETFKEAV